MRLFQIIGIVLAIAGAATVMFFMIRDMLEMRKENIENEREGIDAVESEIVALKEKAEAFDEAKEHWNTWYKDSDDDQGFEMRMQEIFNNIPAPKAKP